MTPIDNTQGTPEQRAEWLHEKGAPKDWLIITTGELVILTKDLADRTALLQQAEAALGEAREQWRMSSVCRELKARNAELEGALREIAAVINERGTGHVVMYSDRMTGFLPRINQLLSPPVGQPDASEPGNTPDQRTR